MREKAPEDQRVNDAQRQSLDALSGALPPEEFGGIRGGLLVSPGADPDTDGIYFPFLSQGNRNRISEVTNQMRESRCLTDRMKARNGTSKFFLTWKRISITLVPLQVADRGSVSIDTGDRSITRLSEDATSGIIPSFAGIGFAIRAPEAHHFMLAAACKTN